MTSLSTQLQWFVACFTCAYSLLQEHSSHLAAPTNCTNNAKTPSSPHFLWAIKQPAGQDRQSYFFGTAHVPYPRIWQALTAHHVTAAFQSADSVYFELDMADWRTVHYISYCQLLPESYTVADVIPRQVLDRVRQYLNDVRESLPQWLANSQHHYQTTHSADAIYRSLTYNWARKRPAWLLLTITALTEGEVAWYGQHVVDVFLSKTARLLHKKVGAVETVKQQCDVINALNTSQVITALDLLLKRREYQKKATNSDVRLKSRDHLAKVVDSYLCGDIASVVSEFSGSLHTTRTSADGLNAAEVATLGAVENHFKDELLLRRNGAMAREIGRLLRRRTNESLFFALGAAHFVGKNSVIERLQQRGYVVEKITSATNLFDKQSDKQRKFDFAKLARQARHQSEEQLWTDFLSFVSMAPSQNAVENSHNQSRQDVNKVQTFSHRHQYFRPVIATSQQTMITSSADVSSASVWQQTLIGIGCLFHFHVSF